jgi:hypothetical protein
MTDKHGVSLEPRLAALTSLMFFMGCSGSLGFDGSGSSAGGTSGSTPSGSSDSSATGTSGTPAGASGSGAPSGTSGRSGSGAGTGTGGTSGGLSDGGLGDATPSDGAASNDAPFVCPTLPVPGTCTPPVDIRCPYPKLSQTGCIDPTPFSNPKVPITFASVVVPYEVNSPLWSDGAYKTRGMRLPTVAADAGPGVGKIHVKDCVTNPAECCVVDPNTLMGCLPPYDDGKWVFPVGTVMVKNFMFPDTSRPSGYKLVETRLFVHLEQPQTLEGVQTEWVGYGYQWDDAQTDATIIGTLVEGSDTDVSANFNVVPTMGATTQSITWKYPSRNDCITCHTAITPSTTPSGGYTLGPETIQMNRVATGDTMNQIDKFAAMGMFETPPTKPYLAALVAPYPGQSGSPPPTATLTERARSYLHANCSFCHRPDGIWNGFDIRYSVPLQDTNLCGAAPGAPGDPTLGVPGALLLTPGNAHSSVVWLRMDAPPGNATTGGTGRMPAIASFVIDTQGTDIVSQWIDSITTCPM